VGVEGDEGRKEHMEPFEQDIYKAMDETPSAGRAPRVLIVGSADALHKCMLKALSHRPYRCQCEPTLERARAALSRRRFDVILLQPEHVAGDWQAFIEETAKAAGHLKTIITSCDDAHDRVVQAMRHGAIDSVNIQRDLNELSTRVDAAVARSRADQAQQRKMMRLRKVCRELNNARREVTEQVDSLCEELVTAYKDVADQVSEASMTSELRTLLRQELDVEELLRTTLEYLLTRTGPTNAAVFLPDGSGEYNLGAYVNYDCPRESIGLLLDHVCSAICPQMEEEREIVRFEQASDFSEWVGIDAGILDDSQVITFTCHRADEALAVFVLFRSQTSPFEDELAATLDVMRGIFAEQLSRVVRIHNRMEPEWPSEPVDEEADYDDFGFGYGQDGGIAA